MLERLARDKHSKFVETSVNYGYNEFFNMGPSLEHTKVEPIIVTQLLDVLAFLANSLMALGTVL
jgi:hypothetical protein